MPLWFVTAELLLAVVDRGAELISLTDISAVLVVPWRGKRTVLAFCAENVDFCAESADFWAKNVVFCAENVPVSDFITSSFQIECTTLAFGGQMLCCPLLLPLFDG